MPHIDLPWWQWAIIDIILGALVFGAVWMATPKLMELERELKDQDRST